jgi:hypothetical protein
MSELYVGKMFMTFLFYKYNATFIFKVNINMRQYKWTMKLVLALPHEPCIIKYQQ